MPKQLEISGTERPKIKEIETAAEAYVKVRDRRMKLTTEEVTAKTNLIKTVLEHQGDLVPNGDGDRIYRYDDMMVVLKPGKANVKVRSADSEIEEDED